jgi:HTH-type transcriptional repressor of NAD biosynthesis genes
MGREVVEVTDNCTYEDLLRIASLHGKKILDKLPGANKLLFVDTDVNITASYSEFLFNKTLTPEKWIEDANHFDLYLFLEPDCEYVQDGTRLSMEERNKLSEHHKKFFQSKGIKFISIGGDWENRFIEDCKIIEETFAPLS